MNHNTTCFKDFDIWVPQRLGILLKINQKKKKKNLILFIYLLNYFDISLATQTYNIVTQILYFEDLEIHVKFVFI